MSYWDGQEWRGGYPPDRETFLATMVKVRHGRVDLVEVAAPAPDAPSESLVEAQQRRREHIAQERAALMTEAQACEALGLDASELYRDLELVAGCKAHEGELLFDAQVIAERAPQNDASSTAKAADLLLELRQNGLDLGGAA